MKWILIVALSTICSIVHAGPPKKAKNEEVKMPESYSVATLGIEAEGFRVQQLMFQGKSTYKVAKLVNGILSVEKDIPAATFSQMKQIVQSYINMESNEDCKIPLRFTYRSGGKNDDQLKLCLERPNVSKPFKKFSDKAKKLLGLKAEERAAEPASETSTIEKTDEPLPE